MGNDSAPPAPPLRDYNANLQPRANSQTTPISFGQPWQYVGPTLDKETIDKLFNMGIQTPTQLNALMALVDQQHHLRDIPNVGSNPYVTHLLREDESKFRQWLASNQIPYVPDDPNPDYDMRGYWKALQSGDPRAKARVNEATKEVHYPDTWKTPSHAAFSNESIYAGKDAPRWVGKQLVDSTGKVVYDETPAPQVLKKPMPEPPFWNNRFDKPVNKQAKDVLAPPETPPQPYYMYAADPNSDPYYRVASQLVQPYLSRLDPSLQPVEPVNTSAPSGYYDNVAQDATGVSFLSPDHINKLMQ